MELIYEVFQHNIVACYARGRRERSSRRRKITRHHPDEMSIGSGFLVEVMNLNYRVSSERTLLLNYLVKRSSIWMC